MLHLRPTVTTLRYGITSRNPVALSYERCFSATRFLSNNAPARLGKDLNTLGRRAFSQCAGYSREWSAPFRHKFQASHGTGRRHVPPYLPRPVNNRPKFRRAPDKLAVPVSRRRKRHSLEPSNFPQTASSLPPPPFSTNRSRAPQVTMLASRLIPRTAARSAFRKST